MKKLMLLLAVIALCGLQVYAQRTVTGKVTNDAAEGLPGVTVVVKDADVTTLTDGEGVYSITLPEGKNTLIFNYPGLETQELAATGGTLNVMMKAAGDTQIGDVMVVAYGTAKKSSFTGSAAKVDAEKIEMKNTSEISKALASEVSGVQVINTSGQPGENAKVRIRGYGSVNASRAPLYVVDGVPYDGDISAINPSDVASQTVLKDASAAALYGSRGANGVIVITTKKGKKGHSSIEVISKAGLNTRILPEYEVIESPEEYLELIWAGLKNRFGAPTAQALLFNGDYGINPVYNMWNAAPNELIDPATGKFKPGISRKYTPESWRDNIFEMRPVYDLSVKFSGGSERTNHYTSFSYRDDKGYYIQSSFKRLNMRTNLDYQVIKKVLKTGLSMSYSKLKYSNPGQAGNMNNGFAYVNGIPPLFPVFQRDKDGNKIKDPVLGGYLYDYGFSTREFGGGINPAGSIRLDKKKNTTHQLEANPHIELRFFRDFTFTSRLGMQYFLADKGQLTNLFYGDAKGIGRVYRTHDQMFSYTWNQILNWSHSFERHNLSAFVGHEVNEYKFKRMYGAMSKIADPDNMELVNGVIKDNLYSYTSVNKLESYIAQAKYDYAEKYFLQVNFRRDGTSRFPNGRWGNFGSVGLAWIVTNENFMQGLTWLKELKLKGSYGVLGNQSLLDAGGYALYYPTYDDYSIENLNNAISLVPGYKGNKDLTWEKSQTINLGFDLNIANVFELGVEYFKKNTTNLLFQREVPRSFGYASLPVNDGELLNTGIELQMMAHLVNTDDWKVNLNWNAAHYDNEIVAMPKNSKGEEVNLEQHRKIGKQYVFGYQKGHSIYDFYMRDYAGVDPDNGRAQWYACYDRLADGTMVHIKNLEQYKEKNEIHELVRDLTQDYDQATQYYIGKSVLPDLSGGFGLDASYKGIRLAAQFAYGIGGYSYDRAYASLMHNKPLGAYNWHKDILDSWKEEGDATDVPVLMPHTSNSADLKGNSTSSRFLTKKSYLALNTVNLSYTFSRDMLNRMKVQDLTFFLTGDNLFLFSKRKGYNPMTSEDGTTNAYRYSPLSTFSLGVKIKF
ncbi:MAG: SusC/RagA family TonB-linked outer membrane protein [Bacteroidia bacterium]|nr:MAG: SusC/RagA family TonB-linked outer membrane protein [Bacteroidia bacterium]